MTSSASHQYACTKCFNWFRFEELTKDSQLCQKCSKTTPSAEKSVNGKVKPKKTTSTSDQSKLLRCKFCRSEFKNSGRTKTYLCDRCIKNKSEYGEPRPCSLCNLTAAFIGSKCRRCTASMKKYGSPLSCNQCKLKAAFKHPKAWVEGQLLCWLCMSTTQQAIRKVKRKASEDGRPVKEKKSKIISSSNTESESSPTEVVIEEEVVIHDKDSECEQQLLWDELSSHDMDYRLPPTSSSALSKEKQMFRSNSPSSGSPSVGRVKSEEKRRSLSPFLNKTDLRHKTKSPSVGNGTAHMKSEPSRSSVSNDLRKHKHRHKETRKSMPALGNLKSVSSKSSQKLNSMAPASKSLDAKIQRLQKKLTHTKTGDGLTPPECLPSSHSNDSKSQSESKTQKTSQIKEPTTKSTSLSSFKVSDSGGASSILDRFRNTDSASSSPLSVVNDGNIVLVTQLRAEISALKKQISKKDQEMIEKDKQISCIKVDHLREQRDLRAKMKELVAKHTETLEQLQSKNRELLKKISQLSKGKA